MASTPQEHIQELDVVFTKHHESFVNATISSLQQDRSNLEKERERLQKQTKGWEELRSKLETTQLAEKVKIDVGGSCFSISKATLISQKGTYFEDMLAGKKEIEVQEDGSYFVDRDATLFPYLLKFLRTSKLDIEEMPLKLLEDIVLEATFYQLDSLVTYIKQKVQDERMKISFKPGPKYTLSEEGQVVTFTGSPGAWESTILGPEIPEKEVSVWSFKLEKCNSPTSTPNVMIGIAPRDINQTQTANYSKSGWYLYTNGATLYSGAGDICKHYNPSLKFTAGTVITMTVDMTKTLGTLSYKVGDSAYQDAWTNIPTTVPLSVCCMLQSPGDVLRILPKLKNTK